MKTQLGNTYIDAITGFTGVATGRVEYITGCNQILLAPKTADPGTESKPAWFDEQRLLPVANTTTVVLENGTTPGCDIAAPIR